MGSSARKKKDKSKDFVKPKLKVGKTKPKASNATDTSFRAKSIVLKQQSLSASAPSSDALFGHHLSLLSSKTDSQRRDALMYLVNSLSLSRAQEQDPLPQSAVTIISKTRPLLIDASKSIRASALEVLRLLPEEEVSRNVGAIQIYVHIGLTHMVAEIRNSTVDVLNWLLQSVGQAAVSCPGGWIGTLKRLSGMVGWQSQNPSKTQSVPDTQRGWSNAPRTKLEDTKIRARQITALARLLEVGLLSPSKDEVFKAQNKRAADQFPLLNLDAHMIGKIPDPYGHLGLFSDTADEENDETMAFVDWSARAEVFRERHLASILAGVSEAKKEGGDVGRAARSVEKALSSQLVIGT